MGTVHTRKRKDGSVSYQAQVFIRRGGEIVHREVRTFDRKQAASAWLESREALLSTPDGLDSARQLDPPLSFIIDRYIKESLRKMGKTKAQVLATLKRHEIADKLASRITSADIVALARTLNEDRTPQTVGNYLSHLSSIFVICRPAWKYPLNEMAMRDALVVAKRLGLIRKSKSRDRRPTLDELDRILTHYRDRVKGNGLPMVKIVMFAMFSTRRQEEILTIKWRDLDKKHSRILVRDMKNPGEKIGNDVWCDLPPEALAIALSMPKVAEEIFPYSTDAVSASFTRTCKVLQIEDLHFHDLRHDGISRLFEMGYSIPNAATVSGHRSRASLQRYTHIRQDGDKYKDWAWLNEAYIPLLPRQKDMELAAKAENEGGILMPAGRSRRRDRGNVVKNLEANLGL